jgi:hypothetical protein
MQTGTAYIDIKLDSMLFDSAAKPKAAALALVLTNLDLLKNNPLAMVDMK